LSRKHKAPSRKKAKNTGFVVGRLFVTKKGFGFVEADGGDYYVSRRDMNGAMNGDTVSLRPTTSGGRGRAGRVVKIAQRANDVLVGRYEMFGAMGVVVPREKRIGYDGFVDVGHSLKAAPGDWVKATILAYPTRSQSMQVVITEVIFPAEEETAGSKSRPQSSARTDSGISGPPPVEVIIAEHDLRTEFSSAALEEARSCTLDADQALRDDPLRRDLRDRHIFTIDPIDAKDFDDAVSVDMIGDTVRLGVHIADVSSYVIWNGEIDREARERTTSVYLPTGVIPMLPERLSNDLCSLKPGVDRLAFTVDMYLSNTGEVERYELYQSVIDSTHRYSYDEVHDALRGTVPFRDETASQALTCFSEIAETIGGVRLARGGLEFDSVEPKIHCDEHGVPTEIVVRSKNKATEMIEEAMILANEVVAGYLAGKKSPTVFRVHESPDAAALDSLWPYLTEFGYRIGAEADVSSKTFQKILNAAKGKPEELYISSLLLRCLKQAYYSVEPVGHFGLASEYYTHFTSPIRRYPDLIVHRILAARLRNRLDEPLLKEMIEELTALCERCSVGERNAESTEREATKYKIAEYMHSHIGEAFAGIITNVASFGLFVSLENSADGLIHKESLGYDEWSYDASRHALVGRESNTRYRVGQKVEVVLVSVNLEEGQLDFELAEK